MPHVGGDVLVLLADAQGDGDELLEGLLHPLAVSRGVVAQDQVEARADIGALAHDVLKGGDGVRVLAHSHEDHADVLQDLDARLLVGVGDLVQCHAVELDGLGIVLLLEVDVGHVHFQPTYNGVGSKG